MPRTPEIPWKMSLRPMEMSQNVDLHLQPLSHVLDEVGGLLPVAVLLLPRDPGPERGSLHKLLLGEVPSRGSRQRLLLSLGLTLGLLLASGRGIVRRRSLERPRGGHPERGRDQQRRGATREGEEA